MSGDGDARNRDGVGEAIGAETPSALPNNLSAPASKAKTFDAVEAEGNEARWRSARETARAVFRNPALVTPKRMALLGEEGLAAFVDEVRSMAKAYIQRERQKQKGAPVSTPKPADVPALSSARPKPKKLRAPAPFGVDQPKQPSARETWMSRSKLSKGAKTFVFDVLFGSCIAGATIGIAILLYRLAPLLTRS